MANYDFTYTGAEIQAILDTAKKLKDSGYIFLGVATPSTNPGTPTQKVYYEAKQAGTYTNFGGVVLPDGISLLIWNGSWTSETVMCGDGGVFDISVYKSSGGTLATFADLSAALDGGNNIPASARKGGMSVKFVQSSDNKYIQARCMAQDFTTDVTQWQGVDDEPTAGSKNLVESGGVYSSSVFEIKKLKDAIKKGANLFDYYSENNSYGKWLDTDGSLVDNSSWNVTDYIKVNENDTIISNVSLRRVVFFNKDFVRLSYSDNIATNTTFNTPTNCTFVRFMINTSSWQEDTYICLGAISQNAKPYKLSKGVDMKDVIKENNLATNDSVDVLKGYIPQLTYTQGYANDSRDEITTEGGGAESYKISNTIELFKGQSIHVKANGNGNGVVAILAKVNVDGSYNSSYLTSSGNRYEEVTHVADEHEYVRISYYINSNLPEVFIGYASTSDVEKNLVHQTVLEVGQNKMFTSILDAVNFINDASYYNQYIIKVYEGTYNTIDTSLIDANYVGLVIPDYVSIVGVGNRDNIVLTATCPEGYESFANNISTLNFMANGVLDNITLYAKNIRYCNHDDNIINVKCKHEYRNVKFVMDTVDSGYDVSGVCVGIGAQKDKDVFFYNCYFQNGNEDNNTRACIAAHDDIGDRGLRLNVELCKFIGGKFNVTLSSNSGVQESFANFIGCFWNKPLRVLTRSNIYVNVFKIKVCCNKDFSYQLGGNLQDISNDIDIV